MSMMTSPPYDTTPIPLEPEPPSDPLEGVGTLVEQAKRERKTRLEILSDRIRLGDAATTIRQLERRICLCARPMSSALADVESFTKLIDDREITFAQLSASIGSLRSGAMRDSFRVICANPPAPAAVHPSDQLFERQRLLMRPTQSFYQAVTRYVNDKTHCRKLTGTFLASMIDDAPLDTRYGAWSAMEGVLNYLFRQVFKKHGASNEMGEWEPKRVLLRTLRPDKTGRWPKVRTCRAILHKAYRDDISHLWLMKLLSELVPTGRIERYTFDGNLLRGAILIPSISRVEQDSEYGGGLFFFSGEIGNRRCGVMPFVYRAINRAVVITGESWGVTHHGSIDLDVLETRLKTYVDKQIPLVVTHLDRLIAAQNILFSEDDPLVVERLVIALSSTFRALSQQDLRLWRVGIFTERNLIPGLALSAFTLQNGVSRMSQSIEDPVRQIQLDQLAGDLLDIEWDVIVKRASTVQDDQVHKIFPE